MKPAYQQRRKTSVRDDAMIQPESLLGCEPSTKSANAIKSSQLPQESIRMERVETHTSFELSV